MSSGRTQGTEYRRVTLLKAYGRYCHWCGDRLAWPDYAKGIARGPDMTIEHLMPKALGGGDDLSNLRLACRACNVERGTGFDFEPLRVWQCGPQEGASIGSSPWAQIIME